MNDSASHATELAENRALLHRVLKEKQALLAKCAEQEVALSALRAEIAEADEARSADAVRLAFKEAALQEQSGWNAQLERKLAEAEAKAKRPHEPRTLAPSRSRSRVPVATPPSAGSSLRRDLRALAQANPAVVSAPPPSKLRPPTPTRKPPTQKPPTPTRKPPKPAGAAGGRRDARKPEYARRSALPTPPAPRHVEVSLPLPDSTLTDEQVEGRAIVSAMVRRVLARVCEESVLPPPPPPPPPPPTEPSKPAEPAAAAREDKVRWDDMMLSALEQQEAALLDSIHDLDKRLSDAPSVGGFVF